MSNRWTRRVLLGTIALALECIVGCTGNNSLSSYARKGDTVMVAFGSANDAESFRREDLTAYLTDFQNATWQVRIRSVINIYPDPTSHVAAETGGLFNYPGLRTAIIDLVDPSGNPLTGQPAQGTANLTLKRLDTTVAFSNIKIEILNGIGTPHPFLDQTLHNYTEALVARPQVRFRVKANPSYTQPVSAVDVELRFPQSYVTSRPETSWPQAIQTREDANLQFTTRYYSEGSNEVIKVIMVNPDGIWNTTAQADAYRGMSTYDTMRFSVAWGDGTLQSSYPTDTFSASWITNAAKTLRVFDMAGNDVTVNFSLLIE